MKNLKITLCSVLSILCIIFVLSSCVSTSKKYPGFSSDDIVEVNISLISESVVLESWDGDTIYVKCISKNSKQSLPEVTCENGIISVVQKNLTPSRTYDCLVKVQYPKSFMNNEMNPNWVISTVSGYISANELTGSVIKAETTTGRISLTNAKATDLISTRSVDGQISLTGSTIKLDAKSSSGSIRMVGTALEVYASTISGSIYTELDKPIVFDSKYNSVSGSINIVMGEHPGFILNYVSKLGDIHNEFTGANVKGFGIDIYKKGSVVIEASSGSGSIWIEKK